MSNPKTRACPFAGCGERLHPEIFACRKHWTSLSPALRARVWSAYRRWQRGQLDGDGLRAEQQAIVDQAEAEARDAPDPAA